MFFVPVAILVIEDEDDRTFMENLYSSYHRLMYHTIHLITEDPWITEDILQSTTEKLIQNLDTIKHLSPSNLRNIDDGTVVQYIKQSMYHYCFRIYKKYHHVETVIGWDEISPKEEAEYLATQDKIQLNDGLLTELQIDVLTKREREIITLMFENSLTAAEIARRWGCSRQSVNQGMSSFTFF